jgi:hypothetical protein
MRFFTWLAGFLEEGTTQSSTRIVMYALTVAAIRYAYREKCDPEVLITLLGAAAAFGGIKLWKDIKAPSSAQSQPAQP